MLLGKLEKNTMKIKRKKININERYSSDGYFLLITKDIGVLYLTFALFSGLIEQV